MLSSPILPSIGIGTAAASSQEAAAMKVDTIKVSSRFWKERKARAIEGGRQERKRVEPVAAE